MSFRELYSRQKGNGPEFLLMHIPNVAFGKTDRSTFSIDSLKSSITYASLRALRFEHGIRAQDAFSVQDIINSSDILLQNLVNECASMQGQRWPIFFICEGFGGVILKETLWKAREYGNHFRTPLKLTCGVIFVATPHQNDSNDKSWEQYATILGSESRSVTRDTFKFHNIRDLQLASFHFDELDCNFPILSAYETVPLRRSSIFARNKPNALVDEILARTGAKFEETVAIDVELAQAFEPRPNSSFFSRVKSFLTEICDGAGHTIDERFETDNRQPLGLCDLSLNSGSISSPPSDGKGRESVKSASLNNTRTTALSWDIQGSNFGIVSGPAHFTPARRSVRLPCYPVKSYRRQGGFFPRDEIMTQLDDYLLPSLSKPDMSSSINELKIYVLSGLGGIGKTEIALQFIHERQDYFDVVAYLHAADRILLADDLSKLSLQLGLETPEDLNDKAASCDLVKGWLANPVKELFVTDSEDGLVARARWLLVIDNADNPDILADYFPMDGHGSVLITSRLSKAKLRLPPEAVGFQVQPFSKEDAAAILLEQTDNKTPTAEEKELALKIAHTLCGIPIAISQMAAIIVKVDLSLAEFLELYQDPHEFQNWTSGGEQQRYENTLASRWALKDLDKKSFALLAMIALFAPDSIPEQLLSVPKGLLGNKRLLSDLNDFHYPISRADYLGARGLLLKGSLIDKVERIDKLESFGELRVHRLVQQVVKDLAKSQPHGLRPIFSAALQLVHFMWPKILHDGIGRGHQVKRWPSCEVLYPQISYLQVNYIIPNTNPLNPEDEIHSRGKVTVLDEEFLSLEEKSIFADILTEAAWYKYELSDFFEAIKTIENAEKLCEPKTDTNLLQRSHIHSSLHAICAEINEKKGAIKHANIRVEINERMCDVYTEDKEKWIRYLATAYNDQGAAYSMNGLYSKASPLLKKSLSLRQGLSDFEPVHQYAPLLALGITSWLEGDLDEAYDYLHRALMDRTNAFGSEELHCARGGLLKYHLGNVRASQKLMAESRQYHEAALSHFRATIGGTHHRTGDACYKVGIHSLIAGQFDQARSLFMQALKIYNDYAYYKAEIARTNFAFYNLLRAQNENKASQEKLLIAFTALQELEPGLKVEIGNLCEADFDRNVQNTSK